MHDACHGGLLGMCILHQVSLFAIILYYYKFMSMIITMFEYISNRIVQKMLKQIVLKIKLSALIVCPKLYYYVLSTYNIIGFFIFSSRKSTL